MADLRISELNTLPGAGLVAGDYIAIADNSASETRKITVVDYIGYGVTLLADDTIPSGKILCNAETVPGSALEPTQPKIERGNAGATLAPSLGSGQIVVPSDPTAPALRRGDQTAPTEDTTNATVPTDQADETALEQVTIEAIETEEPYGKAIDLYARDGVSDEGKPRLRSFY